MVTDRDEHEQLIHELDRRQDDVLERLDELNRRIVRLVELWTHHRAPESTNNSGEENEVFSPAAKAA